MHGSPDSISDLINKLAAQREQAWINFRRARHTAPEPSGEETETSQVILQAMLDAGLEAHIPNRGVGVVADLHAGEAQSRAAILVVRDFSEELVINQKLHLFVYNCKAQLLKSIVCVAYNSQKKKLWFHGLVCCCALLLA